MNQLEGKVAIVTGAGSRRGQGEAEARLLAKHGATVVLADLPGSDGQAIADEIGEDKAIYRELDVTDEAGWRDLVRDVEERYGRIDILVNNAGVWLEGGVVDTALDDYRRVMEINQVGVFLGMHTVVPVMQKNGGGSIINTSSAAGVVGRGWPHAYAASKWAVRGMTRTAAAELAPDGIRVNSICPGPVNTAMIHGGQEVVDLLAQQVPMGYLGAAKDVAPAVLFLASDDSSYVSGTEIVIDGATNA